MNDGIEARFFGHPAMTASALATLALRLGCPVLPDLRPADRARPLPRHLRAAAPAPRHRRPQRRRSRATQAVNDRLEAWIRAKPESWLWLHRRWPKEVYAGL